MGSIEKNPIRPPDYESIAPSYDARYQDGEAEAIRRLIDRRMDEVSPGRWLEVGCGTGQWLLNSVEGISPIGLDQSWSMLAEAASKLAEVPLTQADAVNLPFAGETFSGAAAIHAIHHFSRQKQFLHEGFRVLRPGGGLLLVGLDAHNPELEWYVYDYFEGTAERDQARYPDHRQVTAVMEGLGFSQVERGLARQIEERLTGYEVLNQPFLQRRGCSQMALLSDEEYDAGIRRIKKAISEDPNHEFRASVRLEFVWGMK